MFFYRYRNSGRTNLNITRCVLYLFFLRCTSYEDLTAFAIYRTMQEYYLLDRVIELRYSEIRATTNLLSFLSFLKSIQISDSTSAPSARCCTNEDKYKRLVISARLCLPSCRSVRVRHYSVVCNLIRSYLLAMYFNFKFTLRAIYREIINVLFREVVRTFRAHASESSISCKREPKQR